MLFRRPKRPSLGRVYASYARQQDARDPLRRIRSRFAIPRDESGHSIAYLCGHSLGLCCDDVVQEVRHEIDVWKRHAVEGHFAGARPWTTGPDDITPAMARLVGASPDEVVVMNALTVNLHLMLVSFYRPSGSRNGLLMESNAFPSDRYAAVSQIRFHGLDPEKHLLELSARHGERTLQTEDILRFLHDEGRSISLILLGGMNYFTGQFFDIPEITRAAHDVGCVVGLDLAHAAGNVPLRLHDWNVDFAVWCSYKYLNAGPGGPGVCFVHERHVRDHGLPRLQGWWGHRLDTRFAMPPDFEPEMGARAWQLSNPSILGNASLRASLRIFEAIGMKAIREKSLRLTQFCEEMLDEHCGDLVQIITPRDENARGAQLSLSIRGSAREAVDYLRTDGIVCDFREPDVIRVAPAPLYNTFGDVHRFVASLAQFLGRAPGETHQV